MNEGVVLFLAGYDGTIDIINNVFDKNLMR